MMGRKYQVILALIVVASAALSFSHLSRPDIITDESSYSTRSIGMVDFDFGIEQPTPWQWVDDVPWWMRLSFHDHPVMAFLLQHSSIKLFGENPFAVRLPSVLAGLASILLLYFICKRLYSREVGLASAAIFAFTVNHVWISRIGLQESILIVFMLASACAFFRAIASPPHRTVGRSTDHRGRATKEQWWLIAAGAFLGFAVLTKYLALILVPIFLILLVVRRSKTFSPTKSSGDPHSGFSRDLLRSSYFFISIFVFFAVVSPIIIYNIQLYRNFGHFDFQFSLLLHEVVPEWQSRPGQDALGSYGNRIRQYAPWLVQANSPYFLIAGFAGVVVMLYEYWRLKRREHGAVLLAIFVLLPFFVFIGPTARFFTILTPWLAIAAGYFFVWASRFVRARFLSVGALIVGMVVIEFLYSWNSVIALEPSGGKPWAWAKLHQQTGSWGFNELEIYLAKELAGKAPEVAITFQFPFARDVLNEAIQRAQQQHLEFAAIGIVYNDNINLSASLWTFLRRIVYDGWPITSAENFRNHGGQDFFKTSGVKTVIFINPTDEALQDRPRPRTPDGDIMADQLEKLGAVGVEIRNPAGAVAFRVYRFELQ